MIQDLTILLLVSLPINVLFHRLKLPSVIGYLIAGILIGPHGLQLIGDPESVESLAGIGVVLLLFVIGLEFSVAHLLRNLAQILGVGSLQIIFTSIPFILLIDWYFELPLNQSIFLGLAAALSSTAIVLKIITDQAELDAVHGKTTVGALLFQDVCVVPLMLIVPLLSPNNEAGTGHIILALLESMVAVVVIFLLSRKIVPKFLNAISKTGSKEHLTLLTILIILATGWVSESLGLTLAMGAFIAGLILSESEFSYQIVLDALPLKDYFVSIFFISIGMLLNSSLLFDSFFMYLGLTLLVIFLKAIFATAAAWCMKFSLRVSLLVGIRLAQIGEFSLLVAGMARDSKLLDEPLFQSFLIVSIASMLLSPLIIQYLTNTTVSFLSRIFTTAGTDDEAKASPLADHVIIAGYGLGGRHLSRVLQETHVSFIVVDLDGESIRQAVADGVKTLFGDATHRDILRRAGIDAAKMIVFLFSDSALTEQGVKLAKNLNPDIYVMVRTHYANRVELLRDAGADQVVPEEFETSIEIFSRVLREYRIPNNIIEQQIELIRLEGYAMFRGVSITTEGLGKYSHYLTASLTESFHVLDDSWVNGKTLREISLEETAGVSLLAIVRNRKVQAHPPEDFLLQHRDILIIFGSHAQLDKGMRALRDGPAQNNPSSSKEG